MEFPGPNSCLSIAFRAICNCQLRHNQHLHWLTRTISPLSNSVYLLFPGLTVDCNCERIIFSSNCRIGSQGSFTVLVSTGGVHNPGTQPLTHTLAWPGSFVICLTVWFRVVPVVIAILHDSKLAKRVLMCNSLDNNLYCTTKWLSLMPRRFCITTARITYIEILQRYIRITTCFISNGDK